MKFHVLLSVVCLSGVSALSAQQKLTFDVVSVKENRSFPASGPPISLTSTGVTFTSVTPLRLIEWAYELDPRQVLGGPPWIRTTRFDVQMRAVEGTPSSAFRDMTKAMLQERFGLNVSVEVAQRPIYKLRLAHADRHLGRALKPSLSDCETNSPVPANIPGLNRCGISTASNGSGFLAITAGRVTMAALARSLTQLRFLDRIVVDDTGLAGEYQISFVLAESNARSELLDTGPPFDAATAGARLFSELRDQLGLKLVPAVGPVAVLHIREIAQPSED